MYDLVNEPDNKKICEWVWVYVTHSAGSLHQLVTCCLSQHVMAAALRVCSRVF